MITKARWDRTVKHLLKIEELTGRKLRKTPRFRLIHCPVENFSPGIDKYGRHFENATLHGGILYDLFRSTETEIEYDIADIRTVDWWEEQDNKTKIELNKKIIQWLKERNEAR